jgi:hypothetical protein
MRGRGEQAEIYRRSGERAADVVRFASEFGLTALGRTRISAGANAPQPPRGKFDGLLR